MTVKSIDDKDPAAVIPVVFDFSGQRLISAIESATFSISVKQGADPDAEEMKVGDPIIQGMTVTQLIQGGVDGVRYFYRVEAVQGELKLPLACYQTVNTLD